MKLKFVIQIIVPILLFGCMGLPPGVTPVTGFNKEKYLGRWYEIARLDHSFERGLEQVSAEYSLQPDGSIKVHNRGFSPLENKWKEATGKAHSVEAGQGYLKVSFFGPFYSSYVIFEMDQTGYQYSFVSGYNHSYLWLLSRTPVVNKEILDRFVKRASELGFDTSRLILVKQK